MSKKVFLEPPWTMHAYHHRLVGFPPAGYEFVAAETPQAQVFKATARWDILRLLLRSSDGVIPTGLTKSWLERWNKPPAGTVLTYACEHLVFRREPWVVEVEFPSQLVGIHVKHFQRFKGTMERALASPYCKRIICWAEVSRKTLLAGLNSQDFEHKIEIVRYSVPPRHFVKEYGHEKVKLLFVGSGSPTKEWAAFEYKGGREVLETFALLRQQFSNLELVVRSEVPPDVKARYGRMDGLRIIDQYIPWAELEREYQSADIYIMPSHTTIAMIMLDAMSYELPVVTIDSWANSEYVEDGKTGLVAPRSNKLPYYYADTFQPNMGAAQYKKAMRVPDPEVVDELAKRCCLLIENAELKRQLGKAGRWEVEDGKFSLARENEKLKRVFDEAITGG